VKLYSRGAKDFGFSKTPEETERVWGDQVLEDMVRVIRDFAYGSDQRLGRRTWGARTSSSVGIAHAKGCAACGGCFVQAEWLRS